MKPDFVFGLENAGWPVLVVNGSLKVDRANSAARRLFGINDSDEPALASIWSLQSGATAERYLDQWERAPVPISRGTLRNKQGELLDFSIAICVFFKDGEKYFLLQLLPEITTSAALRMEPAPEKRDSGETIFTQKQKLDCALQLARTVALDFNNALTSILGHTSLILSKMEPQHPWRGSLLEVEKSAAWAAEIAADLGSFSRQDKETKTQTAGNLNAVLQRTVEIFQQNTRGTAIQWNVALERKLFTSKFEEAKLQQAFSKILENAVEALTGSGRITIQTRNVELAEKSQDRNVQLPPGAYVLAEISDNGHGIAPDVLPKIFEPFFTTKGGAHKGVGLAWVYGVVTNQGGGVAVSSQANIGTSVRVYLPAESRIVKEGTPALEDLRGTQTVLIVDDEELLLTMGQTVLSAYGYRVLTANSGEKALEVLAQDSNIDLVITDLVMPSMSGRELVEHIARHTPELPVLCTSGFVWQGTQDQDTAYLQKPFTSQDLLLKVKQVLGGTVE